MLINTYYNPITAVMNLLTSIGAINWGLVGMFDFNLVVYLFGASVITKTVYILVGISGLYNLCILGQVLCHPSAKKVE